MQLHVGLRCQGMQAELPREIVDFVQESTGNYGKVKLVLQRNKYFVESPQPAILDKLLKVGCLGCRQGLAYCCMPRFGERQALAGCNMPGGSGTLVEGHLDIPICCAC